MTREEAIKKIKKVVEESVIFEDELEAFDIAIKALEHPEKNVVAVVPCGDAISRQAVLDAMYELCGEGSLTDNPWRDNPHIDAITDAIENLPSVTLQQRAGRWIPTGYDGYADGNPVYDWWECSECGWEHTGDEESLTAFCPNCGAKMEVEE